MTPEQPLTPPQQRAIAALLEHDERGAAAKAARVSERTLRRWLAEDERFRAELARRGARVLADATTALQRGAPAAARALLGMAEGTILATYPRVAAARAVLDLGARLTELAEVEGRLAELEAAMAERAAQDAAKKPGRFS